MRRALLVVAALVALLAMGCGLEGPRTEVRPLPLPPATAAETGAPAATASPTVTVAVARPATPSAPPGCRNSTSASCGPFRFDPSPKDDRLKISARTTKAGREVTFTIHATDADSRSITATAFKYGDGVSQVTTIDAPQCARGYGPWDPPPSEPGDETITKTHTYPQPGEYEATFTFRASSGSSKLPGDEDDVCIDPYRSSGKIDVVVKVS